MDVSMMRRMATAILAAAVLWGSAGTLTAQTAPANAGQADPPTIVAYRKAFMNASSQRLAALRALASGGDTGLRETELRDHIRRNAAVLYESALLMTKGVGGNYDLFPLGSVHPSSRATGKIWAQAEGGIGVEFAWRVRAFTETAGDLVQVAQEGSIDQIRDAVGRVQVTCRGCHASMRGPAPPSGAN